MVHNNQGNCCYEWFGVFQFVKTNQKYRKNLKSLTKLILLSIYSHQNTRQRNDRRKVKVEQRYSEE